MRTVLKSKIHGARVTHTELEYAGSITISPELIREADIAPYERVQIVNLNNGSRIETYVIPGEKGSDVICLNGPAARTAYVGDRIHILSYALVDDKELKSLKVRIVKVDEKIRVTGTKELSADKGST